MLKELFTDYFSTAEVNNNKELKIIQNNSQNGNYNFKLNDNLSLISLSSALPFLAMVSGLSLNNKVKDY